MIEEAIKKLTLLLQGRVPEPIDTEKDIKENEYELAILLNRFFSSIQEIQKFILPLSNGKLEDVTIPPPKNILASPFKELHSHMKHLTWQTKQVANGDYSQRVDFMGEFSEAFNSMIVSLDKREQQLKKKIDELASANSYIENLEGIFPICVNCKKIRREKTDPKDQNNWEPIEKYLSKKTSAEFSHSICPECIEKLYPDLVDLVE
jgi:hypothetical protein